MLLALRSLWEGPPAISPVFAVPAPGGTWTAWHSDAGIHCETGAGRVLRMSDKDMLLAEVRRCGATIRCL